MAAIMGQAKWYSINRSAIEKCRQMGNEDDHREPIPDELNEAYKTACMNHYDIYSKTYDWCIRTGLPVDVAKMRAGAVALGAFRVTWEQFT